MYSIKSRVRYSECDTDFNLTLASVVNYLQDCSTFQSTDIGVGTESLRNRNRAWLLSSWQIVVDRLPHLGENIEVGTQAYEFKGFYGMRNFLIRDESGVDIVKANSVWFYYDICEGKPVKVDDVERNAYPLGEKLEMDYAPRKISVPELSISAEQIAVTRSMLDSNKHVNNGQYIMVAEQLMKEYFADTKAVGQIRAEYKRQARLGDVFYPYLGKDGDTIFVDLRNDKAESYAIVAFDIKK